MMKWFLYIFITAILSSCGNLEQNAASCGQYSDLTVLEQCAKSGDAKSQYNLGARYLNAIDAPKDLDKAFYWTEKAAQSGIAAAQSNLGLLYYNGWGVIQNHPEALRWTHIAVKNGSLVAYNNLGSYYAHGVGGEVDWKKSAEYYQLAANHQIPQAYQNLAIAYSEGKGVPQDLDKAVELIQKAIELGHQEAIYNLSGMYFSQGKEKEALKLLRQAAEMGMAHAQAELALELTKTAQIPAQKQEARQWLEKALAQNDAYAYAVAGVLHAEKNRAFPYDEAKAYQYLKTASDMGEETSKHLIGLWYWTGKYLPEDEQKALLWFEDAARHGDVKAARRLVEIYAAGEGSVPKDPQKAAFWQNKLNP